MNEAITILEHRVAEIRKEAQEKIAGIELAIACLRGTGTTLPTNVNGHLPVLPGLARMTRPFVLELYMRSRNDRHRVLLSAVVKDLLASGVNLGTPDRHHRNLLLSVLNRKVNGKLLYGWDENAREIWLTPAADEQQKTKLRRSKRRSGKDGGE